MGVLQGTSQTCAVTAGLHKESCTQHVDGRSTWARNGLRVRQTGTPNMQTHERTKGGNRECVCACVCVRCACACGVRACVRCGWEHVQDSKRNNVTSHPSNANAQRLPFPWHRLGLAVVVLRHATCADQTRRNRNGWKKVRQMQPSWRNRNYTQACTCVAVVVAEGFETRSRLGCPHFYFTHE